MKTYYVSLVRSLIGYCIRVKAPSEEAVRKYCQRVMGKMWFSVYPSSQGMQLVGSLVHVNEEGEDE